MAKQLYTIKDWSGGINNRKDPRDISEREFSYISNMSIDALGKIKSIGGLYDALADSDGDTSSTPLTYYIVSRTAGIENTGGYNAFYFESDHSRDSENNIEETKSGTALTIGTSFGNIKFIQVQSRVDVPQAGPEGSGL
tara:strand:- start:768 stop:1184 length:417 start_codon:yes stop_codon:yes gene_type:complete